MVEIVQQCWGKRIPFGRVFNEGVRLDIMLSKQRRQEGTLEKGSRQAKARRAQLSTRCPQEAEQARVHFLRACRVRFQLFHLGP